MNIMKDKDNAINTVAGILIYDEILRQKQAAGIDQEIKHNDLSDKNHKLSNENSKIKKSNVALRGEVDDLEDDLAAVIKENRKLYNKVLEFKKLLAQPMREIAKQNDDFKKTYKNEMEFLADWMVSQKAFKELAIQYGNKFGIQPEEVIAQGKSLKQHVLKGENNPSHNTNADEFILLYSPKKE